MGLAFYACSHPFYQYFSYFFCLLYIAYACMYGYINSIVGTCQTMVQRQSLIFCHYLWKSWNRGLDAFSVATTKCTGLIQPWSNFGLLFCLTCQFFYNCGRSFAGNQWCSQDRNIRDRDVVKISKRDRDFIKNSETETRDLKFETETSKYVHFAEILLKNVVITSDFNFFQISGIFRLVWVVFYLQIQQTKNRWITEILINHFFAIFKVSRSETFETETRKNGSRDESRDQDEVSRLHHCR